MAAMIFKVPPHWGHCSMSISNTTAGAGIQPPDAENRMSGDEGEVMGAIPSPRPDPGLANDGSAPGGLYKLNM
jgi:hypothetical protein